MNNRLAFTTAAAFISDGTRIALNKQQVTGSITAIRMRIGRPATLMANGNDLPGDSLAHPAVKDKILAPELVDQPLLPDRVGIVDDPTLEMVDIREPLVQQPGAGFLATDPAGAVHDDGTFLLIFQHLGGHRELLPERI
jgi:hypothetical protein